MESILGGKMEFKEVAIDSLVEYPDNPRTNDIDKIAESLDEHGQYRPLTVNKNGNVILTGNHTWLAMKKLGWETCLVTFIDVDELKAKKIVLVDNRLNDIAEYDSELLSQMLQELVDSGDLIGTGFVTEEIDELLKDVDEEIEFDPPVKPEPKPKKTNNEAVHDIIMYLDEKQYKNYKKWVNALAEEMKCNLTEAVYNAVKYTHDDLGL